MDNKSKETKKTDPYSSLTFIMTLSIMALLFHLDPVADWIIPMAGVIFGTRAILKGTSKWMILLL